MIGDGKVGSALKKGLQRGGYVVEAVGNEPEGVRAVADRADLVVLAVPYDERENAFEEMGAAIDGKTLVDVTNAMTGDMRFAGDLRKSGAEELQEKAAGAHIVKAFNTVFAQHMATGRLHGEPLSLFVASDDSKAKQQVVDLGEAIGFEAVDAGPLENARWLETLGFLNIRLGLAEKLGTDIGFRLLRPSPKKSRRPVRARAAPRGKAAAPASSRRRVAPPGRR